MTHANAPNASARSAWRRSIADEVDDDDSAGTPLSFSARVVVVRRVVRRVAGIVRAIVVVVVVVAHGMVAVRRQPRAREWRNFIHFWTLGATFEAALEGHVRVCMILY